MRLKHIAEIKTNFPEADFWLIRKGYISNLGKPTKTFNSSHIGIKVTSEDVLPNYLFYALTYLHSLKYFEQFSKGVLNIKHITVDDVKNIKIDE
jgi:restriction endonuclease S subunit